MDALRSAMSGVVDPVAWMRENQAKLDAARESLKWALAKVPMRGWKPEYVEQFTREYNSAVCALALMGGK